MKPTPLILVSSALMLGAAPVRLAWDPSPDTWIQGYHIYRATGDNGPFNGPINETIVENTWYVDDDSTLDPGGTYCYRVTAVNADDRESAPSSPLCIDRFSVEIRPEKNQTTIPSGTLVVLVADTGVPEGVHYAWAQQSGPEIRPATTDTPEISFLAPDVNEATELTLKVTATYGTKLQTDSITLTIAP